MMPAGVALAAVTPGVAAAAIKLDGAGAVKAPTAAHARAYEHAYAAVARKLGRRRPGRNIIKDGLPGGRLATDAQTVASLAVLRRMLAPAPTPVASSPSTAATAPATSAGASG